jgi:hypothetical protein
MRRCLGPLALIGTAVLAGCGSGVSRTATATPRVTVSAGPSTRTATGTPPPPTPALSTPTPAAPTETAISQPGESGIEGRATIGPTCPVQRIDSPCPDRAYEATITVLDAARNRVAETRSDTDGHFLLLLAPGTYVLVPQATGALSRASEQTVTVAAGHVTAVEIVFDSGIR